MSKSKLDSLLLHLSGIPFGAYNRAVGRGRPTFVIAEIGNNHNGRLDLAKKTIVAAAFAGANAVKFQKRFLSEVFTQELLSAPQTSSRSLGETYGEYRQSLELGKDEFIELRDLAHGHGMAFGATPFDLKSVEFLAEIGMDFWKVASFDATHPQLLEAVARMNQTIFLSTGMSTLEERDEAVAAIIPFNKRLVVLHCVSVYPTPDEDLNIGAISTMLDRYHPLPIGYSGHEIGFVPTIAAVCIGACAVERHLTTDKTLPGPDHATVSLNPNEFYQMVQEIRKVEKALADKAVYLHEGEIKHRKKHAKNLVAKVHIPMGTAVTADMIAFKSTGRGGMKPALVNTIVGKVAKGDILPDTVISTDLFE